MIINRISMEAVFNNFRADYEAGLLSAKPLKERIAMTTTSSTREETYAWLGQSSALREWIGQRVFNNLVVSGFTIKNLDFELTVTVPRNDIEDDQIGVLSNAFKMMGQETAMHPDQLVFDLLRKGTTAPCFDGQPFFDTDHPLEISEGNVVSVSNVDMSDPTGVPGWVLLDTSKVIKPFIFQQRKPYRFISIDDEEHPYVFENNTFVYGVEARVNAGYGLWQLAYASDKALDANSFAAARAAMMSLKAPSGRPLGILPDVMLVAPAFEDAARKLLNLGTSHYKDAVELIVCPYMA